MSVYKDKKTNKWRTVYRYTDWRGEKRQTQKRGFKTKREAQQWEYKQLSKANADLDMTFGCFVEIYVEDMKSRLKESTWHNKEFILRTKILPYFENRKLCDIKARDIIAWQNKMIKYRDENGKKYSPVYLKTMHNQLSAIFNHAVRYYDLPANPAAKAGNMGKSRNGEMKFWTQDEYKKFAEVIKKKPRYYYAFEMLYWCGIREGEMFALTPADFNFEKGTVSITKTFNRINGKDIITDPKTEKSNRVIKMPDFLTEEIQNYIGKLYDIKPDQRIFDISKTGLIREMDTGSERAGVKRIRIHDLRHSHISLLIEMGFSAVDIASRVGHESIEITYRYAHMFPSAQNAMANKLDDIRREAV